MLIRCGYEIAVSVEVPTALVCMLEVHPDRRGDLQGPEAFVITPPVAVESYVDRDGNRCRRLTVEAGTTALWGDVTVADDGLADPVDEDAREVPVPQLPPESLMHLLGSRYVETDLLGEVAWDMFGAHPPGFGRVQAVCDFVHDHITFDYMQARATRTAAEAFEEGVGVCRDFAHLALALCRCLNIPARYVNGYLGDIGVPDAGPMDFSAWIEVYLGDRWWTFDPRNNARRVGRVVVARGRDAADVPLINSFGPHRLESFRVWSYEVPASLAAAQG